jgi:pullulanase/glycogen debranching enzyme
MSLLVNSSSGFYLVAVGNMISDPIEKAFTVYVDSNSFDWDYKFTELDLFYSANSIADVECNRGKYSSLSNCVFIVKGAGVKMIEFEAEKEKIQIVQYVNYKSHADFETIKVQHSKDYFVCFAFSPTFRKYALLVYSTHYKENVYLHSYLEVDIGQDAIQQNFKYGIQKNEVRTNKLHSDNGVSDSDYTLSFI